MPHRDDLPFVEPFRAPAHWRDTCDVCFSSRDVRHLSVPEVWMNPDTGRCIDLLTWHTVYLCDACLGADGGMVSTVRFDGSVVIRTGSDSRWPGRLIILTLDVRH